MTKKYTQIILRSTVVLFAIAGSTYEAPEASSDILAIASKYQNANASDKDEKKSDRRMGRISKQLYALRKDMHAVMEKLGIAVDSTAKSDLKKAEEDDASDNSTAEPKPTVEAEKPVVEEVVPEAPAS
ncbi:MAG: hypothetical protein H6849_04985 [Alphaproteobacteria bacterium]|nr:MAG: hypothetical protein H6849_04985 [Alphaproteobacteria bacterium]